MAAEHLNLDTAAKLLDLTPAELTKLADRGIIPRVDRNAYNLGPLVIAYVRFLRDESIRIERAPTQAEIAAHLDISDRRLRELMTEFCLDHKAVPMAEIRVRYLRKLREEAAGRATSGDLDLATERAGLAKAQRERIEMQNAVTRGELAPRALLSEVLANTAPKVCSLLDSIVPSLKRRSGYKAEDLAYVDGVIAQVQNTISEMSLAAVLTGSDDITEFMEGTD